MSTVLQIEFEDDVAATLQKEPDALASELRIAAAVKWYEAGIVSQDKAAEIADLSRSEFIMALSRFSVSPFQENADEVVEGARIWQR